MTAKYPFYQLRISQKRLRDKLRESKNEFNIPIRQLFPAILVEKRN